MENYWAATGPDWAVAVGTFALAAVTFVGLRIERRDRKELQAKLDEQRSQELANERIRQLEAAEMEGIHARRAQADQVVAWSDVAPAGEWGILEGNYVVAATSMDAAWVQNESSLPTTNVNVGWFYPNTLAPVVNRTIAIVPPRSRVVHFRPPEVSAYPGLMEVEIFFRDARGLVWKRGRDGILSEVDPYGTPVERVEETSETES